MSHSPFPAAPRSANTCFPKDSSPSPLPITQGSQTSPPAMGGSRNFPAPLQHPGVPDTYTPQTLGVPLPSQPQGSKAFPTSQRSQSLLTISSTQGSTPPPPPRPPAPRAPSPFPTSPACKGPNPPPLSKLQSPSSSLPTPSPKGSQPPPTPQNPGIQAPFHPLRILAPPQAPSTQGSQTFPTLKGPIPSPLAPSPLGPRFPTPSTQGCHHPPSATTRVSH